MICHHFPSRLKLMGIRVQEHQEGYRLPRPGLLAVSSRCSLLCQQRPNQERRAENDGILQGFLCTVFSGMGGIFRQMKGSGIASTLVAVCGLRTPLISRTSWPDVEAVSEPSSGGYQTQFYSQCGGRWRCPIRYRHLLHPWVPPVHKED